MFRLPVASDHPNPGHPPPASVKIPLSPHGVREMVILAPVLSAMGLGLFLLWWPLAVVPALLILWLFAFFRDPERTAPEDPELLVSPADGKVSDVTEVERPPLIEEPCLCIGIFLSVFNVHVNRAPITARVFELRHRPGRFLDARHPDCSAQNESHEILLRGEYPVLVRQIAGLIARRIVCTLKEGDAVERGQRIGLIKFGSRTELYIPLRLKPEPLVQVGQKVAGTRTAIARLARSERAS